MVVTARIAIATQTVSLYSPGGAMYVILLHFCSLSVSFPKRCRDELYN